MKTFMAHQKEAFDYAKDRSAIALFMEMRLGKTLVALRWAEHRKCKRNLIVAPLPVLPSWEEELLDEGYAYEDIHWLWGVKNPVDYVDGPGWYLANFESLFINNPRYNPLSKRSRKRIGGPVAKQPWDCIIVDESTRIRNPQSETARHLVEDTKRVENRAILSGLPAPEGPLDYCEQFRFLHGEFMGCRNYWNFRKRYFMECGYEYVLRANAKAKVKQTVHDLAFVKTRKQAGIGSKKIYSKRYVEMNPKQRRMYIEIDKGFEYTYKGKTKETKWVPVKYLWYGQIAGGFTPDGDVLSILKFQEIVNLLKGELKNEPVVVWFRYNTELQFVARQLQKKGFTVGVFFGDDKTGSNLFKSGRCQVLCAQTRCGQQGIDWSRSSTAIYYSNYYDGEVRAQSEDRIIHPKKREPVLYIDLICRGSIDEDVSRLVQQKKVTAKQFSMKLVEKWSKDVKRKINYRSRVKRNRVGAVG